MLPVPGGAHDLRRNRCRQDTHWACALDAGGRVLPSRTVRNTQADLDALSTELRALPGPVQVGLDVDGSIATFLQALLLADGVSLVHVPGLAVNRAAHGYAGGERKSDPQNARVIADLVRTRDGLRDPPPPSWSVHATRCALRSTSAGVL